MNYCPDCGVAVRGNHELCPLCGSRLQNSPPGMPDDALPSLQPDFTDIASRVRKRPWIIGLVAAVVLMVPGAVSLAVDLFVSPGLSWSGIVMVSLFLLLLYISLPSLVFFTGKGASHGFRFILLMFLNSIATWGFLIYVDVNTGSPQIGWSGVFGGALVLLTLGIILIFYAVLSRPGAGRRAWTLFLWLSAYGVGVDLLIIYSFPSAAGGGWSLIVAASLIPIGLMYLLVAYLLDHSEAARRRLHL